MVVDRGIFNKDRFITKNSAWAKKKTTKTKNLAQIFLKGISFIWPKMYG